RQMVIDLVAVLEKLSEDSSPQVRREAALALNDLPGETAAPIWAKLATQYPQGDRWYLEALGIGSDRHPDACFDAWKNVIGNEWNSPAGRDIVWRTKAKATVPLLVELIQNTESTKETERYFRALDFRPYSSKNPLLAQLLSGNRPDQTNINFLAIKHMDNSFSQKNPAAQKVLGQLLKEKRGSSEYLDLVESLNLVSESKNLFQIAMANPSDPSAAKAAQLLRDFEKLDLFSQPVNGNDEAATIDALNLLNQSSSWEGLEMIEKVVLDENRSMKIRKAAVQYLGRGWSGENKLVALLEKKQLPKELEIAGATQLLSVYREGYRKMASEILNLNNEASDLAPIHDLVAMEGNTANGMNVFNTYCKTCHVVNDEGIDFGPNLSEIGSKLSKEALYGSILQPSAGISFGYESYLFTLKDGTKSMGYIASETSEKVDLKMAGGIVNSIKKEDIQARELMDQSLMTEGLEKAMSQEELVDLVAYLSSLKRDEVE
ncbi:MAG: c-type cytochrome, partial [Bacteroidetes bacterium]|nr:c-type cytochrome [Bacteroidota bacterium]